MAALDFLRRSKRDLTVLHVNHNTPGSDIAMILVQEYCDVYSIPLTIYQVRREKLPRESWEEFWRNERMVFFQSCSMPVVTGHNLDDACEWWIFSSLHGEAKLIPATNGNIIRPFLLSSKREMWEWCHHKGVPFTEDPSNKNLRHPRNRIRHEVMESVLEINPGFQKVIKKKILSLS